MKKIFALILSLMMVLALLPAISLAQEPVVIDIIEVTDFHGALVTSSNQPVGAVLTRHIKEIREDNPNGTLLLGGGDMYQGTSVSNILKGVPVSDWMDYTGFDVMAVGNHEFDWGLDTFEYTTAANATYDILANNIYWLEDGTDSAGKEHVAGETRFDSYGVYEKNGVKIAVIGSIADGIESAIAMNCLTDYEPFGDVAEAFKNTVAQMNADGVEYDCIISLVHGAGSSLTDICALADDYPIVAVFGGHSHGTNTLNYTTEGGKNVPYYVAASNGYGYVHIQIEVDAEGNITVPEATSADYVSISTRGDENGYNCTNPIYDEGAQQIVLDALASDAYTAIANEIVGFSSVDLPRRTHGLNDWTCEAIAASVGADVAFTNSGGLRCNLDIDETIQDASVGNIPYSLIYQYMPFDNFIYTVDLSYAEFEALMKDIAANYTSLLSSGVYYGYDSTQEDPANRLVYFTKEDGTQWQEGDTIRIAVPDFVLNGGDNFLCFRNLMLERNGVTVSLEQYAMDNGYSGVVLREALADDLRNAKEENGDFTDLSTRLDYTPRSVNLRPLATALYYLFNTTEAMDGSEVNCYEQWAQPDDFVALETAMTAVLTAVGDKSHTEVIEAMTALSEAIEVFEASLKYGDVGAVEFAVMSTTDMHGRSTELDAATGRASTNSMPRIASLVKDVRAEYENTILIDNGDTIQGTLVATYWITKETAKLNPMIDAMIELDYDVWNMGNHEFNYNPLQRDTQVAFAEAAGLNVLSANLVLKTEGENFAGDTVEAGEPYYKPYIIKQFTADNGNAVNVAVIGIGNAKNADWDVSTNYPNMQFSSLDNPTGDIVFEVNKWVDYINNNESADIIIVAAHSGAQDTYEDGTFNLESQAIRIITETTGVDLVIAGHDHYAVCRTYQNADGEDVYLVNGGGYALTNVVFKANFDADGAFMGYEIVRALNLNAATTTNDVDMVEKMQPYYDAAEEWVLTPLGNLAGEWVHSSNTNDHVLYQTDTLDLVHKAQIWATWLSYESEGIEGATVSLASPVFNNFQTTPREVNMRDMISLYRYENTLYAIDMTGAELKAWLNTLANNFEINASGSIVKKASANIFGMDSVYGVDYLFDISRPEGERLVYCYYNGELLEDDTVIRVAINNYRLSGAYGWNENVGIDDTEAVWSAAYSLGSDRSQVKVLLGEYFTYMETVTADDAPYKGTDSEWAMTTTALYGDVDRDGDADSADAAFILQVVVSLRSADKTQQFLGDVTDDGSMDSADAAAILRYVVQIITEFEAEREYKTYEVTYESSVREGVEIPAVVTVPKDSANYPFVILAHGHGGNKDEGVGYARLAMDLAEQGIASIRMDFPGCGDSTESFKLNTMTNMKNDVVDAIAYMIETYDVEDYCLGIVGYSMGGRIALELVAEEKASFDTMVLLAPAADTEDLKALFGGADNWEVLKAKAETDGFATFTTIYGQVQDLSIEWFNDLEAYPNRSLIDAAAAKWDWASTVLYNDEDVAVSPAVSQAVAAALDSDIVVVPSGGHDFGFYSADEERLSFVSDAVLDAILTAYSY
ncbi:MAG: alpha/beta fold hydrolase [Clostridia bacterium]|nr:alpha/beta fold hydrolase [Clostridia bacterium]